MRSEKDRPQPYRSPAQQDAEACAANEVAILIPCHRVVNKNGKLGGYGGGLRRKQHLLALEGVDAQNIFPIVINDEKGKRRRGRANFIEPSAPRAIASH